MEKTLATKLKNVSGLSRQGFKFFIDLLFPVSCLSCGADNTWFCAACFRNLPLEAPQHCPFCGHRTSFGQSCSACHSQHALDGALAFIPYANKSLQKLIHVWKYQSVKSLSPILASLVSLGLDSVAKKLRQESRELERGLDQTKLSRWPIMPTLILSQKTSLIPVPLSLKRFKSRGFNQAEELARCLERSRHYNFEPLIKRTRHTAPQANLSGSDRLTNIKEAFSLIPGHGPIADKNFLIVDDVITTGSTCESLARLLKNQGAASVWALAVAYGHPL